MVSSLPQHQMNPAKPLSALPHGSVLSSASRRAFAVSLTVLTCTVTLWTKSLSQVTSAVTPTPAAITETPVPSTPAPSPVPVPSQPTSAETTEQTTSEKTSEPILSPEEVSRQQKLIEADQLYLGGQFKAAEKLYREVKATQANAAPASQPQPQPFTDPADLSPGGKVYWRESETGLAQKMEARTLVPLKLLVEQYPQFVPGHIRYAAVLQQYDRLDQALVVLEQATNLYPNQPDLLKARIAALAAAQQWMEASIAARQFALLNPNDASASEFKQLADENLQRFQGALQERLTGNAIANFLTGALSYALTGSLFGPLSAVQTTAMLLQGESGIGERVAEDAKRQLKLIDDPEVVEYVSEIGRRIATLTGRMDFKYQFYVINDDKINAFALPGGKVFINAGAITNTNSEAELAGLMAHEVSHAVLSHGFQLIAEGNLLANATQFIPLGGILANLFVLDYSREMERQADLLGTRVLAATGYAADGMRNLMVALKKDEKSFPFSFLLTHPVSDERITYLDQLIDRSGYNRYAYEGVARHNAIKAKTRKLLAEKEEKKPNDP